MRSYKERFLHFINKFIEMSLYCLIFSLPLSKTMI